VASYPNANLAELTPIVYKREFAAVDEAEVMQAAELLVKRSKWFPTIAELRTALQELQKAAADDEWLIAWDTMEVLKYKRAAATWATCPECGERTPSLTDCPFCADIAQIQSEPGYEPAGEPMIDVAEQEFRPGREYAADLEVQL
jgi:hypothetical protein